MVKDGAPFILMEVAWVAKKIALSFGPLLAQT